MKTQLGLGLAAIGRPEYINIKKENVNQSETAFRENAMQVLDNAYSSGIRMFDTAPSYGKGESFLIDWQTSRQHQDVFLSTKWGYTYMANWELGYAGKHEIKEHSSAKLLEQWQTSKQLLPQLKLYQVHSATLDSGIFENKTVHRQLLEIKKETGLKIGITTSGAQQSEIIEKALEIEFDNETVFDSFQVTYNVFEQSAFAILTQLLDMQKTVIVKEAMANGRVFPNDVFLHYSEMYSVLKTLSKKYKVGVDAVAIRFIIDSLQPDFVLSGALTTQQLQDNLKALSFHLNPTEIEQLKAMACKSNAYWSERSELHWQ